MPSSPFSGIARIILQTPNLGILPFFGIAPPDLFLIWYRRKR
nr:MAG TPA: hypothetical protein [Caudoviricetes sp.]DAU24437.1 MAG TPA: hypothetical protein [Caudoviricetes sp.]